MSLTRTEASPVPSEVPPSPIPPDQMVGKLPFKQWREYACAYQRQVEADKRMHSACSPTQEAPRKKRALSAPQTRKHITARERALIVRYVDDAKASGTARTVAEALLNLNSKFSSHPYANVTKSDVSNWRKRLHYDELKQKVEAKETEELVKCHPNRLLWESTLRRMADEGYLVSVAAAYRQLCRITDVTPLPSYFLTWQMMKALGLIKQRVGKPLPSSWEDAAQKLREEFALVSSVLNHIPKKNWFNVDETACRLWPEWAKTWARVGAPPSSAPKIISKAFCTVVVGMSTSKLLPPQVIWRGSATRIIPAAFRHENHPAIHVTLNSTHWSTIDTMIWYIDNVVVPEAAKDGPDWRFLLLLDRAPVHVSSAFRQKFYAKWSSRGVILYVPSGCTAVLQPCDVGIMGPLKASFRKNYVDLLVSGKYEHTQPTEVLFNIHTARKLFLESLEAAAKSIRSSWVENSWRKSSVLPTETTIALAKVKMTAGNKYFEYGTPGKELLPVPPVEAEACPSDDSGSEGNGLDNELGEDEIVSAES